MLKSTVPYVCSASSFVALAVTNGGRCQSQRSYVECREAGIRPQVKPAHGDAFLADVNTLPSFTPSGCSTSHQK